MLVMILISLVQHSVHGRSGIWELAMNINPSDGHIANYCNNFWYKDVQYGSESGAFAKDFVSKNVRRNPVNYIAIVRHANKRPTAVKVWKFSSVDTNSLLDKFGSGKRKTVTQGGHIYQNIIKTAHNLFDDPVFSVGGDLIFNYEFADNGIRIVLSESPLSEVNTNDDNTHGLGMDIGKTLHTKAECKTINPECIIEVAPIQDCPFKIELNAASCGKRKTLGTDSTGTHKLCEFQKVPDYGSYAIYVGSDTLVFPKLEQIEKLSLTIFSSKYRKGKSER